MKGRNTQLFTNSPWIQGPHAPNLLLEFIVSNQRTKGDISLSSVYPHFREVLMNKKVNKNQKACNKRKYKVQGIFSKGLKNL